MEKVVVWAVLLLGFIVIMMFWKNTAHSNGQKRPSAQGEASAASDSTDSNEEEEAMPIPETGMMGIVTDPIPGRGFGEIKVLMNDGVELYFMAACHGEDWIPAGTQVEVHEVKDGIVYVIRQTEVDKEQR
jgi:hypothetical protein